MERKAGKGILDLLRYIRRGSTGHLWRLMKDWPHASTLSAAQAVISLLTLERQSQTELDLDGLDLAQAAILAVARAMYETDQGQQEMKPAMIALLLPKLDGLISWMALCLRYARGSVNEDEDEDNSDAEDDYIDRFKTCVTQCGTMFCTLLDYDVKFKIFMQSSAKAAEFLVSIWTMTDPDTGCPLFMVEPDLEVARKHGCIINSCLFMFVAESKQANAGFLNQLCPTGDDRVAADTFIQTGIDRLNRIKEACENREWESLVLGRNVKDILNTFDQFLTPDNPEVVRSFHEHSFICVAMSTVCSMTRHIKSMNSSSALAFPLALLMDPIQLWPSLPGASALDGMCQLAEGGLLSVFLDILVGGPCAYPAEEGAQECVSLCWNLFTWIASYGFYPSTYRALHDAIDSVDESRVDILMKREGALSTKTMWCMLRGAIGLTGWVKETARMSKVCDNILCDPDELDLRRTQQKSCAGCRSAIYCSEECQKMDWDFNHHEDCRRLKHEHIERERAFTSLRPFTRILHLSLVQEVFRLSVRGSFLETEREKSHPDTPLSNLIVTFNFASFPILTEESLTLSTVPEFLKRWGKVSEDGELGELGARRLETTIKWFLCRSNVRLVQALFRLKDGCVVWLLARLHIPRTEVGSQDLEGAIVVGGFSSLVSAV